MCACALLVSPAVGGVGGDPPDGAAARAAGMVGTLHRPVAAGWSADVSLWPGAVDVAGLLVGVESTPDGGTDVVAIDAGTGATAWRALPGGVDRRPAAVRCAAGPPEPSGDGLRPSTVLCLVAQRTAARVDHPVDHELVTLGVRTGTILSRRPADSADPTTAREVPPASLGNRLVVDGRVVVADGAVVTAVDARTGRHLWQAPVARVPGTALVTDGRLLLATVRSDAGDVVLAALGVDDGRQRWASDLGDDLRLLVAGGRLFGVGSDRLVSLDQRPAAGPDRASPVAPRRSPP